MQSLSVNIVHPFPRSTPRRCKHTAGITMHLTHSAARIGSTPHGKDSIHLMHFNRHIERIRDMCAIRPLTADGRLVTVDDCW